MMADGTAGTSRQVGRKPSLFKRLFKRSSRHRSGSRSSSSVADTSVSSAFSPISSRRDIGMPNGRQKPQFEAKNGQPESVDGDSDDKMYDEHSEGELDLHDLMSDEDVDAFSGTSHKSLSLLDNTEPADLSRLLADVTPEDLVFPKYIKATRKNNKSPRVLNNLFLAQELHTEPVSSADAGSVTGSDTAYEDEVKAPMNPHEVLVMEFSRDGKYLAVAGRDSKITVWQVISSPLSRLKYKTDTGLGGAPAKKNKVFGGAPVFLPQPVRVFEGHTKSVLCLDWSKNNFLLSGSMDKTVRLWNIERADCLETFQHRDFVTALRFHPNDDRFFISGALDNQLRLWSVLERSVAYTSDLGDNALITAVEFTPFGNYCMVGGFNGSLFAVETQGLLLVKRIELRKKLKPSSTPSSHGTTISGIKIFENPTCADLPSSDLARWNVLITTNDSTIRLVDLSLRKLVTRFRGNSNQSSSIVASISEDGRYIISGSEDHYCYVWDNNNSIINNKLRASMKEMLLESKNHVDEKHKRISRLLHDNRLWRKLPVKMFLEDENGKKYVANDNTSYACFPAHQSRVNVALFAPEKTKRLLQFSDDRIFDLVKRGTLLAESRGNTISGDKAWGSDHIIVTSDVTGLVRVYRQDPAFYIRKNFLELKKMQKRDRARHPQDPTLSPDINTLSLDEKALRARSKSPAQEGPSRIRSKLSQRMRSPYRRTNSTSSARTEATARAARSNSDLSRPT
ncbi:hypothetical protein OXX80_000692 [Metschnikowia pulcherrima]